MAFVIADRVRESSTTTGTGNFTLGGAVIGYQTFDTVLDTGDTTYYTIADQGGTNWEVGIGTFTSPSTLARTTILSSSNGGSVVTFGAGTKDVFISLPASKTNTNDQPNVISVNSTSNALRITQTGTGNALVVEDAANPDSSPVAVDADGRVLVGYTSSISAVLTGQFQLNGTTNSGGSIQQLVYSAAANAPRITLGRSNSGTIGTNAVVLIDENMGEIRFVGNDGTGFVRGAAIAGVVDGTPGTNDMPGRLIFSTTADGASIPTERMRIDSGGRVGIGVAPTTASGFVVNKIGSTSSPSAVLFPITIPQTATGTAILVDTIGATTEAAAFTLGTLMHYRARPAATFGAGSSVTNQYGFWADGALTGATNNFGFYSNIAAGTGRWNFYANGTADNYFAGNVGIGTSSPGVRLQIEQNQAAYTYCDLVNSTNGGGAIFRQIVRNIANTGTTSVDFAKLIGSGLAINNNDTNAANFTSFGVGASERLRINSSGNVGIGTSSPGSALDVKGTLRLSGATSGYVGLAPAAAAGSTTYTLPAADGTSGQVLSTNGSGTLSWASATGTLKNVQVFTSSGTYTRTAGVTTAVVIARGGGGGGGSLNAGSTGGTTSFGSHVTAVGGSGGAAQTTGGQSAGGAGGTGGTGALIAIRGAPGETASLAYGTNGCVVVVSQPHNAKGGGEGAGRPSTAGVRGGGGGGGTDNSSKVSGGGGQGELSIDYITTVGATETVTIGAGGAAGTSGSLGGAGGPGYIIVYEYS